MMTTIIQILRTFHDNQTAKLRRQKQKEKNSWGSYSCSPNVTTSAGHFGPAAQPAQGRWLSHPVAAGLLAKAAGFYPREEHTLPGSKVVILLPGRK